MSQSRYEANNNSVNSILADYEYCPSCGSELWDEGEISNNASAFKWQYCDCGWHSDVIGYRLVHYDWGTGYEFDPTLVGPDAALFKKLSGKIRVEALTNAAATFSPPTALCPNCAITIQLRNEIADDCSAYNWYWICERCGYRTDNVKTFAPGVFPHSREYRWISWRGTGYTLTQNQAEIVKMLHRRWLAGAPDVHQSELMGSIGIPASRVRDSFRCSHHELLGTLIFHMKGSPRGTLRLDLRLAHSRDPQ